VSLRRLSSNLSAPTGKEASVIETINGDRASGYTCPECKYTESDILNIEVHVLALQCLQCGYIWLAEM